MSVFLYLEDLSRDLHAGLGPLKGKLLDLNHW